MQCSVIFTQLLKLIWLIIVGCSLIAQITILRLTLIISFSLKRFEGNLPNSPFRPCFKKLFDVVQMYGKDVQAAGSSRGTSKFLLDVARQNAEMTINLQRTILNNKQRR